MVQPHMSCERDCVTMFGLCVLCSVLEIEKSLVLAEKGSGDNDDVELIIAGKKFRLVATMNPGGDFGKKEVSVDKYINSHSGMIHLE